MKNVITVVALIVFATSLSARNTDPIIGPLSVAFGTELTKVTLLSTAFALPFALVQPVLGAIADMMGKARLMMICLVFIIGSAVMCAFAPNFETLMAGRVLAGLATGGVFPSSAGVIADLVPMERRQVVFARVVIAGMGGNLVGASLAGIIGDLLGWKAVFLVTMAIGIFSLGAAYFALRQVEIDKPVAFDLTALGPNYRAIFRNPQAKVCFAAVFLEGVFVWGFFPYVSVLLLANGETRASIAGMILGGFGLGAVLYGTAVAQLQKYLNETNSMRTGVIVVATCLVLMGMGLPWQAQIVIFTTIGFGFYLLHGVIQIYAMELSPQARASSFSLFSAFYFLGQASGPVYYGLGISHLGSTATLAISACGFIAIGIGCSVFLRRAPKPHDAPT